MQSARASWCSRPTRCVHRNRARPRARVAWRSGMHNACFVVPKADQVRLRQMHNLRTAGAQQWATLCDCVCVRKKFSLARPWPHKLGRA